MEGRDPARRSRDRQLSDTSDRSVEARSPEAHDGPGAPRTQGVLGSLLRLLRRADREHRRHAWLAVPVAIVRKYGDDRGAHWAALIAYYGFFSLFPLLLVLVTVLGFAMRNDTDLQRRVLGSALAQFPIIGAQLERNVQALTGSGWVIAVGIGAAIWSGMGVIGAIQGAMDEVWNVPRRDRPGFVRSKLEALAALLVLGVATLAAGILAGVGTTTGAGAPTMQVLALLGTLLLNVAVLGAAMRWLTEADISWRDIAPGATVGAACWMLLLVVGTWIVDRRIRGATQIYGFFGIVLGLLGWLYLSAQVLLVGAEFNVVLKRRLWPRSVVDHPPMTGPDRRVLAAEATEEAARPEQSVRVEFDDEA